MKLCAQMCTYIWNNAIRPKSKPKTERSSHFLVKASAFYSCSWTVGKINATYYEYVNLV